MNAPVTLRTPLKLLLASPRGFCAGVDRAVQIVEQALAKYGAPVFVRHEIVHNRHVVERLKRLGAVFIEDLADAPEDRPIIVSAHGAPKSVHEEARRRSMIYLDATCPLVSKVHAEAVRHHAAGREVVLVGHAGHPEVNGTMGQLPDGAMSLVETAEDVARLEPEDPDRVAFLTQTTLSVDDASEMLEALRARFPKAVVPRKQDICYATTNRQEAVKAIAVQCDLVLVVGSQTSSNSLRLAEVALSAGAPDARLIEDAGSLDWRWFDGARVVGLTAGASAPEHLVQGVIDALAGRFDLLVEEESAMRETVTFRLPRALAS